MGCSISWLAVRGKDSAQVRTELGLSGTGEREELAGAAFPLIGTDLPGGWYLVLATNDCAYADNTPLRRVSRSAEIVTCGLEEHVMYSAASGWQNGRELWWITRDSQEGLDHLEAGGHLPSIFGSVRDRLAAKHATAQGVDYIIEVPIEVAGELTGFRHDKARSGITGEELIPVKKWWEFWK